jgi:hypothetical protein
MIPFDLKLITTKQDPIRNQPGGRGGDNVYYDGVHIGLISNAGPSYPHIISTPDGNQHGSFKSRNQALKMLAICAGIFGNIFKIKDIHPNLFYILRVSQISLVYSPKPNAESFCIARVYYSVIDTYGTSSASKPCRDEICEINLITGEIETKKNLKFSNQEEIIAKLRDKITEITKN